MNGGTNIEWAPVTTATPLVGSVCVEIDSPVPSVRIRLRRDVLARLLAGVDIPETLIDGLRERQLIDSDGCSHSTPPSPEGIVSWREHGWGLSLSYYLWSRRSQFLDDGADGEERKECTLARMAGREPCPQPRSLAGFPVTPLTETVWARPSLGAALARRRSSLQPRGAPIRLAELSTLLREGTRHFRASRIASAAPGPLTNLLISYGSAIDIYVLIYQCDDLDQGVYQFDPMACALVLLRSEAVGSEARAALLAHPDPKHAAATIVLAADFARYQWRYRHERALRNLWVDTGRIMQELLVAATALYLKTGITPAVDDTRFLALLGLDHHDHQVLHTLSVAGPPRASGTRRSLRTD